MRLSTRSSQAPSCGVVNGVNTQGSSATTVTAGKFCTPHSPIEFFSTWGGVAFSSEQELKDEHALKLSENKSFVIRVLRDCHILLTLKGAVSARKYFENSTFFPSLRQEQRLLAIER